MRIYIWTLIVIDILGILGMYISLACPNRNPIWSKIALVSLLLSILSSGLVIMEGVIWLHNLLWGIV